MTSSRKTATDPATVPIYLAFADGVFDYVCAECTALCCKGHGMGGHLHDGTARLLEHYPALGALTISRRGDSVNFATSPAGCFFLESDNRCRIEKEYGKALKPSICTLFPFNDMRRIGTAVAVMPHFLCPLRLNVPPRPGEVEGSHERVEPMVRESPILASGLADAPIQQLDLRGDLTPEEVVQRETSFRDTCAAALGGASFYATLREAASDPEALDRFATRAATLFAVPELPAPSERDGIDDVLLAIAPAIRLAYLKLSGDGILRALVAAELLVRRATSLATRPVGPHEVMHVLGTMRPAIVLAGHGDEPLGLRRAITKVPPLGDPALTFAAFGALRGLSGGLGVLDTLERTIPAALPSSDRTALLMSLGALVEPALPKRKKETTRP